MARPRRWPSGRRDINSPSIHKLDDWLFALAGYGAMLRASDARITPATHFTVADFCTRAWRNCARALHRLPPSADARRTPAAFRHYWTTSSPLSASELAWAYLRRGRIRRWLQLRGLLAGSR